MNKYSVIVIFSKTHWDVFEVNAGSKEEARQLAQLDYPGVKIGVINKI